MTESPNKYPASLRAAGLVALDYHNGDADRVSKITGFPASTLRYWARNRNNVAVEYYYMALKKDMAARLEDIAHKALDAIDTKLQQPGSIPLAHLTSLLETSIDKLSVLSGQPTNISGSITVSGNLEEFHSLKEKAVLKLLGEAQTRSDEGCPPESQIPVTPELVDILNAEVEEEECRPEDEMLPE